MKVKEHGWMTSVNLPKKLEIFITYLHFFRMLIYQRKLEILVRNWPFFREFRHFRLSGLVLVINFILFYFLFKELPYVHFQYWQRLKFHLSQNLLYGSNILIVVQWPFSFRACEFHECAIMSIPPFYTFRTKGADKIQEIVRSSMKLQIKKCLLKSASTLNNIQESLEHAITILQVF